MKFGNLAFASLASLAFLAASGQVQAQAQAQLQPGKNDCPANAPYLSAGALKAAGFELPVFKRFCYSDKSGSYALVLGEKQDAPFSGEVLSSTLQAALYKLGDGNALTRQWAIRDFAGADYAGVNFRSKLIEFPDLDADGRIEPVLVYRFFVPDGNGFGRDAFSGGIKIVTFHQGRKVVIHAITGDLDHERKTTANSNYFALPKAVQQHLVKKMEAMYTAGQFGFDNSYEFVPRKEGAR